MPFGFTRDDLAEAERFRVRRAIDRDTCDEAAALTLAAAEELLQRRLTPRISALHRNGRIERQQRGGEIAIAATARTGCRRRSPYCGSPVRRPPRRRMQEGEFAVRHDLRHRNARADGDARAGGADFRDSAIGRAYDGGERNIALVDRAHHQRAAAKEARRAIGLHGGGCLAERRECSYRDRHCSLTPPDAGGSRRSPPDRSARPPFRPSARPRRRACRSATQLQNVRSPSVTGSSRTCAT